MIDCAGPAPTCQLICSGKALLVTRDCFLTGRCEDIRGVHASTNKPTELPLPIKPVISHGYWVGQQNYNSTILILAAHK